MRTHHELCSEILREEEMLVEAHRSQIDGTMCLVKEEMELLKRFDAPTFCVGQGFLSAFNFFVPFLYATRFWATPTDFCSCPFARVNLQMSMQTSWKICWRGRWRASLLCVLVSRTSNPNLRKKKCSAHLSTSSPECLLNNNSYVAAVRLF